MLGMRFKHALHLKTTIFTYFLIVNTELVALLSRIFSQTVGTEGLDA